VGDGCREKVVVPASKPYITFEGAGRDATVVEWHDRAGDRGPDGQLLRTYNTASVTVLSNYFTAKNISFKVSRRHYLYPSTAAWSMNQRRESQGTN
jgi:pectin methylesterase-like acyl-CoA thioesterase